MPDSVGDKIAKAIEEKLTKVFQAQLSSKLNQTNLEVTVTVEADTETTDMPKSPLQSLLQDSAFAKGLALGGGSDLLNKLNQMTSPMEQLRQITAVETKPTYENQSERKKQEIQEIAKKKAMDAARSALKKDVFEMSLTEM